MFVLSMCPASQVAPPFESACWALVSPARGSASVAPCLSATFYFSRCYLSAGCHRAVGWVILSVAFFHTGLNTPCHLLILLYCSSAGTHFPVYRTRGSYWFLLCPIRSLSCWVSADPFVLAAAVLAAVFGLCSAGCLGRLVRWRLICIFDTRSETRSSHPSPVYDHKGTPTLPYTALKFCLYFFLELINPLGPIVVRVLPRASQVYLLDFPLSFRKFGDCLDDVHA